MTVTPTARYFVAQVKSIAADGSWSVLVMDMLKTLPVLVTMKAPLINTYMVVVIE